MFNMDQVSFSPAIQSLLVNLNQEYEITNDAISFVNELAETLLVKTTVEASELVQQQPNVITSAEIQEALKKLFPAELARQAISEATMAINDFQTTLKEDTIRDAISEFEVIEDTTKKVNVSAEQLQLGKKSYLLISPELILKFLSQHQELAVDETTIDKSATIFLSSSLEYFLNRLLDIVGHKSCPTLTKPAFQSVFEEGEVFYSLWANLHATKASVAEESTPAEPINESPVILEETSHEEPTVAEGEPADPQRFEIDSTEFLLPEPRLDVKTFVAPLLVLLGQACAGFDITSRGMQIMTSFAEYLLRFVVVETAKESRHKGLNKVQVSIVNNIIESAFPVDGAQEALAYAAANTNSSQGRILLLVHSAAELVHPLWEVAFDEGVDNYIANVLIYAIKHTLNVAAVNARSAGLWVIRGSDALQATQSVLTVVSPLWQAIASVKERSLASFVDLAVNGDTEGPLLKIPTPPRINAADKIYFTSIYCETPLQTDNQLLIMFLFLASLSLRAIIVA